MAINIVQYVEKINLEGLMPMYGQIGNQIIAPTAVLRWTENGKKVLTMTKYIKLEELMKFPIRRNRYNKEHGNDFVSGIEMVLEYAKNIPAADVAPVRHGRWVDKQLIKSFKNTNIPVVECSACGIDFCDIINNHYFMYKYCPNCGAKMDGGED